MEERNKILTEAMGDCWHEPETFYYNGSGGGSFNQLEVYGVCRQKILCIKCGIPHAINDDFLTWEGFGKLWDWATKQGWWEKFTWFHQSIKDEILTELINPEKFAKAVAEFLQEK